MTESTRRRFEHRLAADPSDVVSAARVLTTRWRAGQLSTRRLELASFLGDDAARNALGRERAVRFVVIDGARPASLVDIHALPHVASAIGVLDEQAFVDRSEEAFAWSDSALSVTDTTLAEGTALEPGAVFSQEGFAPTVYAGATFADHARAWESLAQVRGMALDGDTALLLRTLGSDEAIGVALVAVVRACVKGIDPSLRRSALEAAGVAEAWLYDVSARRPFDAPRPSRSPSAPPTSRRLAALLAFVRFFGSARRSTEAPWGVAENALEAVHVVDGLLDGPGAELAAIIREPVLRWALRSC